MPYRLILFLVFGALLAFLGEKNLQRGGSGFAAGLDRWWLDFCVANARDRIGEPAVSFVAINDEYKPALGDSLSQADYAAVFGFVGKFEPKAVAFEPNPVFDESLPINQTLLQLLKEAALPLPRLTLGAVAENGQAPRGAAEEPKFPALSQVEGDLSQITPLTRVVAAPNPQLLSHGDPAFTRLELAGDETGASGRTVPLIARQGDQIVPSFIVLAVAAHAGVPIDQVAVTLPPAAKAGTIQIGDRHRIPIDARGRMRIYEHSGAGPGFFPAISAIDLALSGDPDETIRQLIAEKQAAFDSLKTNLVVIGHDRAEDRREVLSTEAQPYSRAGLLARAIATVQSGRYIDRWPRWARLLSIAAIAALALAIFRRPRKSVVGWSLVGAFLWFGIAMIVFKSTLSWAPPFAPLALFALMLVVGVILPEPKAKPAAQP